MPTIHDYLRWRGDLTFDERPFNEVDNLALSALAYLDFTGIVPAEGQDATISLAQACTQLLAQAGDDVSAFVRSLAKIDEEFVRLLMMSDRFGDALLHSYADEVDKQQALQFAAVQVDLPHAGTYVAFRGTDNTIVGWRENFMLSFTVTEAQRKAARYLHRSLERTATNGQAFYVGGHSKGGTLAEYALRSCSDEEVELVTRAYSNDGPGMARAVIAAHGSAPQQVLSDKICRIVPAYSVIGMLFARDDEPRTIVQSNESGIAQHDLTTWQVTHDSLVRAPGLQRDCRLLNQVIAQWMHEIPLEERAQVTKQIFDALEAGGATSLNQIVTSPESLQPVLHALGKTDDKTREVALSLVQCAVGSSVEAVRTAARRVLAKGTSNLATLPRR